MLTSEESGRVVELFFESGGEVQAGALLVQLDTSVEQADLQSALARAELALVNEHRMNEMLASSVVAQEDADKATAELKQAKAEVASIQAKIDRKTIRAPFDGTLGIRLVQLGQTLSKGDPLASLQTLDPIYIDFSLPQQSLAQVREGAKVIISVDAFPDEQFEGHIQAVDSRVDDATRMVRFQATLQNPERKLKPGMFARAVLFLNEEQSFITVPLTAVQRAPFGDSLYIVETMKDPAGKEYLGARQQFVKLGRTRGDQVAVLEGLAEGEVVVSGGGFKLHPGAPVQVDNSVTPSNEAAPSPTES